MSDLKPCPFCGATVDSNDDGAICCNNAECIMGGGWFDATGCENTWNCRPIEDQLRARLAAAEQRADQAEKKAEALKCCFSCREWAGSQNYISINCTHLKNKYKKEKLPPFHCPHWTPRESEGE